MHSDILLENVNKNELIFNSRISLIQVNNNTVVIIVAKPLTRHNGLCIMLNSNRMIAFKFNSKVISVFKIIFNYAMVLKGYFRITTVSPRRPPSGGLS